MHDLDLSKYPEALQTNFLDHAINAPVAIYEGPCEFWGDDKIASKGNCKILYEWLPSPRLSLIATGIDSWAAMGQFVSREGSSVRLPEFWGGQKVSFDLTCFDKNENGDVEVVGSVQELVGQSCEQLTELHFHLANGPEYLGDFAQRGKSVWRSRASLCAGGWKVDLDALSSMRTKKEQRDEQLRIGGYAITHVGRITREGNREFSASDADKFIGMLYHFFAFCRGGWSAPLLLEGRDPKGSVVMAKHRPYRASRAPCNPTWFSDPVDLVLEGVFPGFVQKWNDEKWNNSVDLAVYWFVAANQCEGGVEGALVLAFAALECLSWTVCVEDAHLLSLSGFEKLAASDKIRLLLRHLGIPTEIHQEQTALQAILKAESNVNDGPDVIGYIRNCYVHSTPKNTAKLKELKSDYPTEAWTLSLHYVELVLLCLFGYQGKHSSRFDSGSHPRVPWASTPS